MDIDEIRRINIRALEKIHGPALAKRAGMSPSQFYNLRDGAKDSKTGKPRGMRKETAWKLEEAAGVARGYLDVLHEKSNVSAIEGIPRRHVPLLSSVRAGTWGEIDDHHADTDELIAVRETDPGEHAFALRVEGDSMTWDGFPSFPEGTVLIVSVQRAPKAGDYVIAKNTKGQKALFKKLMTDGENWQLNSLNKDYKPIPIEDAAVRVIGVVVEYWMGGKL